ncbi:hypothetical protein PENSPDRAFT_67148 [Peniophora sp. CONT]|nr:hypothetical protein PENSPDRAFT_67148 [Peniophora sp. CONT]
MRFSDPDTVRAFRMMTTRMSQFAFQPASSSKQRVAPCARSRRVYTHPFAASSHYARDMERRS